MGLLPIGQHPDHGRNSVSLFWSLREDQLEPWRQRGLTPWKKEALQLWPESAPVLDQITSPDQLIFARYRDVRMKKWHDGNLLCIGDAAHSMSPQLGQGISLGLYDAWILKECLSECDTPAQAFEEYSYRRRRHLRFNQMASALTTPLFQSSVPRSSSVC